MLYLLKPGQGKILLTPV